VIVITGSESFIGNELKRTCRKRGVAYLGIDVAPSNDPNHCQASICGLEAEKGIPQGADALVHLAALSTDKACRADTRLAFEVNVGGTLNLIRVAQARGVKQFIFASTEWVYGDVANAAVQTEDTPIDANRISSEYAMTKIVGERLLALAQAQGAFDATVLRFGIVYGPRLANWSAVEQLFNAVRTKDLIEVGSLATARRFIHVSDIAAGILSAVGRGGYEIFNLAGSSLISLRDIIDRSAELTGRKPEVVERNPGAVSIRNPESSRARRELGWEPSIGLREGLSSLLTHQEEIF
jgi:nucleoside-diphosphate-sugar epimerase